MTLMPVSNICARGSSVSKSGAGAVDVPALELGERRRRSTSSGSPITLKTWPSTASPTGTWMPWPVLRTAVPRVRPSVGFRQMARTRLSPICWATSASTDGRLAVDVIVELERVLISGSGVGRELDVDHRAGDGDDPAVLELGSVRSRSWCSSPSGDVFDGEVGRRSRVRAVGVGVLGAARRASAPPTISMISVVMASWRARFMTRVSLRDELLGVVGGRLHGPLAGGVLGRRGVEQGGVEAGLDVAGQERVEDGAGRRLELVVGAAPARTRSASADGSSLSSGTSGRLHDLLDAGRDEPGVDELAPRRPRRPRTRSTAQSAIGPGVLVGRLVGEAGEGGVDRGSRGSGSSVSAFRPTATSEYSRPSARPA